MQGCNAPAFLFSLFESEGVCVSSMPFLVLSNALYPFLDNLHVQRLYGSVRAGFWLYEGVLVLRSIWNVIFRRGYCRLDKLNLHWYNKRNVKKGSASMTGEAYKSEHDKLIK